MEARHLIRTICQRLRKAVDRSKRLLRLLWANLSFCSKEIIWKALMTWSNHLSLRFLQCVRQEAQTIWSCITSKIRWISRSEIRRKRSRLCYRSSTSIKNNPNSMLDNRINLNKKLQNLARAQHKKFRCFSHSSLKQMSKWQIPTDRCKKLMLRWKQWKRLSGIRSMNWSFWKRVVI